MRAAFQHILLGILLSTYFLVCVVGGTDEWASLALGYSGHEVSPGRSHPIPLNAKTKTALVEQKQSSLGLRTQIPLHNLPETGKKEEQGVVLALVRPHDVEVAPSQTAASLNPRAPPFA